MFLLNSCLSLFSAARSLWHPLSRSYGVILPSSLTMLLPPALGFSPHPPVSVYGTGAWQTIAAFLDRRGAHASLLHFAPHHGFVLCTADLPAVRLPRLYRTFHFRPMFPSRVPTVLLPCGTGISTCCPSATLFSLTLGPDFPRADQLYPGDLGYSATRILTLFSLLIPAFSLLSTPQLLTVLLLRVKNAPLPMTMSFLSFGGMF